MSRIHEALKRAEQERAGSVGTPVEPAHVPETAPIQQAEPATSGAAAAVVAGPVSGSGHQVPSFGSPFTFDTLLARCVQSQWSPDEKTMLFFNQDELAAGTEEFRTLRSRLFPHLVKT